METVQIDTEELDQPITVCTHKDCVEYRQLNNGGVVETIYKTECHVPCYLVGVEVRSALSSRRLFLDKYLSQPRTTKL